MCNYKHKGHVGCYNWVLCDKRPEKRNMVIISWTMLPMVFNRLELLYVAFHKIEIPFNQKMNF